MEERQAGQERLFGTDGIRGEANIEPMTSETALRLGRALAYVFKHRPGGHKILIGRDTRLSGYMIETAMASGLCSMGVDVLLVGPMPTPGGEGYEQGGYGCPSLPHRQYPLPQWILPRWNG